MYQQEVPISNTLLKQKAHQFAEMVDVGHQFRASNGWLKGFNQRHDLVFQKFVK